MRSVENFKNDFEHEIYQVIEYFEGQDILYENEVFDISREATTLEQSNQQLYRNKHSKNFWNPYLFW